jgi:hypothetical protein
VVLEFDLRLAVLGRLLAVAASPSTQCRTLPDLAATVHRDPEDDFFCLRYAVWYPSFDCAIRTAWRTAPGCLRCEQGRFNLKRHRASLRRPGAAFARLLDPPR